MKQPNPTQDVVREERRRRRFDGDAVCVRCGESDLSTLTPVVRTLLEDHHVCGAANAPSLTVPLCLNCHRKMTERLERAGVAMTEPRDVLEMLVMVCRALADFFRMLAECLLEWSDRLARLVEAQDAHCPTWRELPESRV